MQRIQLWDLPTRLFHWSLALLVCGAIITGKIGGGAMVWHGRIGIALVGLLVFRLIWGFVGSTYARFAQFMPTPASLCAYLRGQWRGLGHNPFGAISVLGLLALLAALLATGLAGNDDIAFRGPLFDLVSKDVSDRLIGWHRLLTNALFALIALHLAAIAFYTHVRKDNLVRPMITGYKDVTPCSGEPARGGGLIAVLVALLIAAAAAYAASGAWLPPPPPPAPSSTPAW